MQLQPMMVANVHLTYPMLPMVFQVITNKLTRFISVGQVRIEFYYKKQIPANVYQPLKTPSGTINVSTAEMTAFDLVRYMNAAGQVNHVATVLSELVAQMNPNILATLLENKMVEVTTVQRLGYLLELLELNINLEPLHRELKRKKMVNRLLVAGSVQAVIHHNQRWHILVNELVEPDEL